MNIAYLLHYIKLYVMMDKNGVFNKLFISIKLGVRTTKQTGYQAYCHLITDNILSTRITRFLGFVRHSGF
jgi:hypothetical protein